MEYIDLRSDTTTDATQEMRKSILDFSYEQGYSYDEDQNSLKLEKYAAELMGKEAASFVPSGTFGNQCAILAAGNPGEQILLADYCHMIAYQNGSLGKLARMATRTLPSDHGLIKVETLKSALRKMNDVQTPHSTIFEIENPCSSGLVYDLQDFNELIAIVKKEGMHVHMDGGRIFYACSVYKIDPKQLVKNCDSIMFCLSKGLSAPIGSMVVGSRQFMKKFDRFKKMLGGFVKKPGILTGMGYIALDKVRHCVGKDIEIAQLLGKELNALGWCEVTQRIDVNIVFFRFTDERIVGHDLQALLLKNKIKCFMGFFTSIRFVVHHYIREEQIKKVISVFKEYYATLPPKDQTS